MRKHNWQVIGILLWRGGLVFVGAYGLYHGAWQLVRQLDWPAQLTVGAAIVLAGLGLVMLSVIIERWQAAKTEGNLLDD